MTTSSSSFVKLKKQADRIARGLKGMARGEKLADDPAGKIAAALTKPTITFALVMDDKIVKIEMPWVLIREMSEAWISAWIVEQMRGNKPTTN